MKSTLELLYNHYTGWRLGESFWPRLPVTTVLPRSHRSVWAVAVCGESFFTLRVGPGEGKLFSATRTAVQAREAFFIGSGRNKVFQRSVRTTEGFPAVRPDEERFFIGSVRAREGFPVGPGEGRFFSGPFGRGKVLGVTRVGVSCGEVSQPW